MAKGVDLSQDGPFGMADGASQNERGFIRFTDHGTWGDLEFSDASLRERIFVGRRGSGKSRYLREQERNAAKKMLVFPQKTDAISLVHLRRLHKEFTDPAEREETWIRLWHVSIHLALGSFLLNSPEVDSSTLKPEEKATLIDIISQNLGFAIAPFSVVAAMNQVLTSTEGRRRKLDDKLSSPTWVVLEHIVAKLISTTRPVAMFIDSIDENFRHAPAESTQAQIGMLLYLARTLTDPSRSNRPHLFVTVRDIIYSQFLKHEQGEKYSNQTHWKLLDWRKSSARYFFEQKIERLPARYQAKPNSTESAFEKWLGVSKVYNPQREIYEEVGDFLLRHTRFLPREVVEIGNALCNATLAQQASHLSLDIWSLVIKEASLIGERALQVLYDHIISLSDESFPHDAAKENYKKLLQTGFEQFRSSIKSEIFSYDDLVLGELVFNETCGEQDITVSIGNLLWQHGLIGYMYSDETRGCINDIALFYHAVGGAEGNAAYNLPVAKKYRLHASLLNGQTIDLDKNAPIIDSVGSIL